MTVAISRRKFLRISSSFLFASTFTGCIRGNRTKDNEELSPANNKKPNFIFILADDLGYGDIGCYGSDKHRTPNIDDMAENGLKLTDFYVPAPCCSPSRASFMTGCYPIRIGMHQGAEGTGTIMPGDKNGLNPEETTIPEILRDRGYSTACIGKWHLGDKTEYMPNNQGFDYFYGLPYSNDMSPTIHPEKNWPPLPLMKNDKVIETEPDQALLTKKYTRQCCKFIRNNKNKPFFLFLSHTMPHHPVNASDRFKGKSANGLYGDAVEEIDWSTGQIIKTLKEEGILETTLVIFTSDNGASRRGLGSNLPFSGAKGQILEGGMREPCIMYWPNTIQKGIVYKGIATIMDFLPTFAYLSGESVTDHKQIDGKNIWPYLFGGDSESPYEVLYYYMKGQLQAVRSGKWKLHLQLDNKLIAPWPNSGRKSVAMKLIDLEKDLKEKNDLSKQNPEVVKKLLNYAEKARKELGDENIHGSGQRWMPHMK